eukprot:TRINITY_DN12991_c0_g1_i1.p1 TRINITY_DN12991_c0_g1~~TRINITY_DN12991_c0_g1_i1.p1  ORF type:complete len:923 (+),score=111.15 TRINITY_DN12991_c0_g1_i1:71-2770(+)
MVDPGALLTSSAGGQWRIGDHFQQHGGDFRSFSPLDGNDISEWSPPWKLARIATCAAKTFNKMSVIRGYEPWHTLAGMMTNLLFAMHPFTNAMVFIALIKTNNPWWASISLAFMLLPFIVMYFIFNAEPRFRSNFIRAFGLMPSITAIFFVNCRYAIGTTIANIFPFFRIDVSPQDETFVKLQRMCGSVFGTIPWTCFQVYICVRQHMLGWRKVVVDPYLLPLNISLGLFTARSLYSYFVTYSTILAGGDKLRFLQICCALGFGHPSPSTLERLRTKCHVVIKEDLAHLDALGLRSLARAIKTSAVVEEVEFLHSNIESCLGIADPNDFKESFWKIVCGNQHRLRVLRIMPPFNVVFKPVSNVDFTFVDRLEMVWNGDDVLFSFDQEFPPGDLRQRVLANAKVQTVAGAEAGTLVCLKGHIIAKRTPGDPCSCDLCKADIRVDATIHSCSVCGYDLCGECAANTLSVDNIAVLAAKRDCWRTLAALIAEDPTRPLRLPSLLTKASFFGASNCVHLLIKCGANVNSIAIGGRAPLHAAAVMGHENIVTTLLELNADPDITGLDIYKDRCPLQQAAVSDNWKVAEKLLEWGASVNSGGTTATLHVCAYYNSPKVAKAVLRAKADIHKEDVNGLYPLSLACERGSFETVRELMAFSAQPTDTDRRGRNGFFFAERIEVPAKKESMLKLLKDGKLRLFNFDRQYLGASNRKNLCALFPDSQERQEAAGSEITVKKETIELIVPEGSLPGSVINVPWYGMVLRVVVPLGSVPGEMFKHTFVKPKHISTHMQLSSVRLPEGVAPETMLKIETPDGQTIPVQAPPGVAPGGVFFMTFPPLNVSTQMGPLGLAEVCGAEEEVWTTWRIMDNKEGVVTVHQDSTSGVMEMKIHIMDPHLRLPEVKIVP